MGKTISPNYIVHEKHGFQIITWPESTQTTVDEFWAERIEDIKNGKYDHIIEKEFEEFQKIIAQEFTPKPS